MTQDILKELKGKEISVFQGTSVYRQPDIFKSHNKIVEALKKKIKELEEECLESAKTKIPYIAKVDEQKEQLQAKDKEIKFWSDDALNKEREITRLEKKMENIMMKKDLKIQQLESKIKGEKHV